jgi:HK97 family phage prohead protease
MEYKTVPFDVTKLDAEGRTIEGYAAVFGNRDMGNDVIHPGAFTKTITERGQRVKFLWQHDTKRPLGPPLELREDSKGLFVRAKVSETSWGNDALALARDGALDGMSIGYDAIPASTDYIKSADGETVRNLRELKLWEFSLVTFPMNEDATVTAVKEAEMAAAEAAAEAAPAPSLADIVSDLKTPWRRLSNDGDAAPAEQAAVDDTEERKADDGTAAGPAEPPTSDADALAALEANLVLLELEA